MSYMTALTIRIPEELRKRLKQFCENEDRSTSEVVRESIRKFLVQEEIRRIRQQLRPRAEARGFVTDEDVFREIS